MTDNLGMTDNNRFISKAPKLSSVSYVPSVLKSQLDGASIKEAIARKNYRDLTNDKDYRDAVSHRMANRRKPASW